MSRKQKIEAIRLALAEIGYLVRSTKTGRHIVPIATGIYADGHHPSARPGQRAL